MHDVPYLPLVFFDCDIGRGRLMVFYTENFDFLGLVGGVLGESGLLGYLLLENLALLDDNS